MRPSHKPVLNTIDQAEKLSKQGRSYFGNGKFAQALACFRKAANQKNIVAQFYLGLMYEEGYAVEEDDEKAIKYYRQAASAGHMDAQIELGLLYAIRYKKEHEYQWHQESVKWYSEAIKSCRVRAERGEIAFQRSLAKMYADHKVLDGRFFNEKKARKWHQTAIDSYRKKAEEGDAKSQFDLAKIYADDEFLNGCFYNGEKAKEWYQKAMESYRKKAIKGNIKAKYMLAKMYADENDGVLFDFYDEEEANAWYTKAARQGHAPSQYFLARTAASNGEYVQAVHWCKLAAEQGHTEAKEALPGMEEVLQDTSDSDSSISDSDSFVFDNDEDMVPGEELYQLDDEESDQNEELLNRNDSKSESALNTSKKNSDSKSLKSKKRPREIIADQNDPPKKAKTTSDKKIDIKPKTEVTSEKSQERPPRQRIPKKKNSQALSTAPAKTNTSSSIPANLPQQKEERKVGVEPFVPLATAISSKTNSSKKRKLKQDSNDENPSKIPKHDEQKSKQAATLPIEVGEKIHEQKAGLIKHQSGEMKSNTQISKHQSGLFSPQRPSKIFTSSDQPTANPGNQQSISKNKKKQQKTIEIKLKDFDLDCMPSECNYNAEIIKVALEDRKADDQEQKSQYINRSSQAEPRQSNRLSNEAKIAMGKWGEEFVYRRLLKHYETKYKNNMAYKVHYWGEPPGDADSNQSVLAGHFEFLVEDKSGNKIKLIMTWINCARETGFPYDIEIEKTINKIKKKKRYIEVKSTRSDGPHKAIFSGNEFQLMKKKGDRYRIFRVYNAGQKDGVKIEKYKDPWKAFNEDKLAVSNISFKI